MDGVKCRGGASLDFSPSGLSVPVIVLRVEIWPMAIIGDRDTCEKFRLASGRGSGEDDR